MFFLNFFNHVNENNLYFSLFLCYYMKKTFIFAVEIKTQSFNGTKKLRK